MKNIICLFLSILLLTSCFQEVNCYNPDYIKKQYESAFVSKYGKIDENQTWDFTTGTKLATTRAANDVSVINVDGIDFGVTNTISSNGYYPVLTSTFSKNTKIQEDIEKQLPNGVKHNSTPSVILSPSNSFVIYPIFAQGENTYDVYVRINSKDYLLFKKDWTDDSKAYYNGMATAYSTTYSGYGFNTTAKYSISKTASMGGLYVTAPIGTKIEIYLKTSKNGKYTGTGTGNVITVDEDVIPDVKQWPGELANMKNKVAKYIGIEDMDLNDKGCDHDFNDITLAIIGYPQSVVNNPVISKENYTVPKLTEKRYLIEDLGSIGDFDFNDIVVDFSETTNVTHYVTYVDDIIDTDSIVSETVTQTATVKHLGGILQWQLYVDDKPITNVMDGVLGSDPNIVINLKDKGVTWDPSKNNISIKVKQKNTEFASETVNTIVFPKKGEAPMIIAVDTDVNWMEEYKSIPSSWFTTE